MRNANNESSASKIELLICFAFLNVRGSSQGTPTFTYQTHAFFFIYFQLGIQKFAHFRTRAPATASACRIDFRCNQRTHEKKQYCFRSRGSAPTLSYGQFQSRTLVNGPHFPATIVRMLFCIRRFSPHVYIYTSIILLLCISSWAGRSGGGRHSTYLSYYLQFGISLWLFVVVLAAHAVYSKNVSHIFVVASFRMEYFIMLFAINVMCLGADLFFLVSLQIY